MAQPAPPPTIVDVAVTTQSTLIIEVTDAGPNVATIVVTDTAPRGPEGPKGDTGNVGPPGPAGQSIVSRSRPPNSADAVAGGFYEDTIARVQYGPRAEDESLFAALTPTTTAAANSEMACIFTIARPGKVVALRFYKVAGDTQTSRTLKLWSQAAPTVPVATVVTTGETGVGWITAPLATPYVVTAPGDYWVSMNAISRSAITAVVDSETTSLRTRPPCYYGTPGSLPSSWQITPNNTLVDLVFRSTVTATATVFPDSTTPTGSGGTGTGFEVGSRVKVMADVTVTALRFYRGVSTNTTTRNLTLWKPDYTKLATVATVNETGSGWQTAALATPLPIVAGEYLVTYGVPGGGNHSVIAMASAPPASAVMRWLGACSAAGVGSNPTGRNNTMYLADMVVSYEDPWPPTSGASALLAGTSKVDTYTTPGAFTWTKPAGALRVQVIVQGPGGGGGSGQRAATTVARVGGGGGGGGSYTVAWFAPADLPATVNGFVGTGGAGAGPSVVDNTTGWTAAAGSANSTFGNLTAVPGGGGVGGQAGAGGGGGYGVNVGGAGGNPNGNRPNYAVMSNNAMGGSGGGGASAANAPGPGGLWNWRAEYAAQANVGGDGAAGVTGNNGQQFATTLPYPYPMYPGVGGGGGGGASGGVGGNGGAGLWGGGGGGGGSSPNGFASGSGGKGGDGFVQVITYF